MSARGKVFTEEDITTFKWPEFYIYLSKNGWDTRRYNNIKTQKFLLICIKVQKNHLRSITRQRELFKFQRLKLQKRQ